MSAADPQVGLLAPLRAGEDAARVRGEERGQQDARQAEEEEHPLADGGVVPRDLERVRDVVDQVVLTGCDARRPTARSPASARARWPGSVSQPRPVDEHVDLRHRQALELVRRRVALAARNAGTIARLNVARADDDRVRHVEEVLELGSTCGWRRAASRATRSATPLTGSESGARRPGQRAAGPSRRARAPARATPRRSAAPTAGANDAGDDPDRRVVRVIAPVEARRPAPGRGRSTPPARSDPGGRSTNDSPSAAATPGMRAIARWSCASVSGGGRVRAASAPRSRGSRSCPAAGSAADGAHGPRGARRRRSA